MNGPIKTRNSYDRCVTITVQETSRPTYKTTLHFEECRNKLKICGLQKTAEIRQEEERERAAFWCQEHPKSDVIYIDDGVHDHCQKHHYDCLTCGKVKQIG